MEEENKEVVEQTTQETTEQVDESKFESAGDDSVIKVDLSKPPKPKEEINHMVRRTLKYIIFFFQYFFFQSK